MNSMTSKKPTLISRRPYIERKCGEYDQKKQD